MSNPTNATITPAGQSLYTWTPAPALSATQALQVPPSGTSRIAAAWYSATSFTVDVNVATGHSYNLELYFLDYDASGRARDRHAQRCQHARDAEQPERVEFHEWQVSDLDDIGKRADHNHAYGRCQRPVERALLRSAAVASDRELCQYGHDDAR